MTGSIKRNSPFILGVAGGSGSGKTYFARALVARLGVHFCEVVCQDNFYIDQSARFDGDGGSVNFDHPESIDFSLLAQCLRQLKGGQETLIPEYDFATHTRKKTQTRVQARPVILVDGILIFHDPGVREIFDDLVFFDTPELIRYQRRLERDVKERGRTPEGVKRQFDLQVKPMHDLFVEPSKAHAKKVVNDVVEFSSALDIFTNKLRTVTS